MNTKIEWTEETWNPVRGCSRVSEGCRNCYAEVIAARFSGSRELGTKGGPLKRGGDPFFGFATITPSGPRWTGRVELIESKLLEPRHWRKPRRVFVNSMSDLFHENLPDESIDRIFAVMALTPHITYQVLTKRARRMRNYLNDSETSRRIHHAGNGILILNPKAWSPQNWFTWLLPNLWLGVSVENQPTADERIPELLRTPAALRFTSYEPALEAVNFDGYLGTLNLKSSDGKPFKCYGLDWGIIGGESGPSARPFNLEWARSTIRQFEAAGVPLFVKQLGKYPVDGLRDDMIGVHPTVIGAPSSARAWERGDYGKRLKLKDSKGGNMDEWPEDLRVREFPK